MILDDVKDNALSIARAQQVIIEGKSEEIWKGKGKE